MTRPGKTAGVLALLAALLVGSPLFAQETDRNLEEQVRALRRKLDRLERQQELDRADVSQELRRIAAQLDRIERRLDRLSNGTPGRQSGAFEPDAPLPAVTGTIRLDNRMADWATVNIDGVDYRVAPFSVRVLRGQPAGRITYTVTGTGRQVSLPYRSVLRANETLTVTIHEP